MRLTVNIGGKWMPVDMDTANSENAVALNYSFDSLVNPTDYVSEFSYTLTVPATKNNKALFDNIQRWDNKIDAATFNPRIKYQYKLHDRKGEQVSRGVLYLQSVKKGWFVLNLSGMLFEVFNKCLNSGYNNIDGDTAYYLMSDPMQFLSNPLHLTKDLVLASWHLDRPEYDLGTLANAKGSLQTLYDLTDSDDHLWVASFFGFAPTNQGKYTDFESGKLIDGSGNVEDIKTYLGISTDVELTERQALQYRSYEQQPYVWVNKLWQLYANEFNAMTGYNLRLDARFFNSHNNLYAKAVYMLPKWCDKETELKTDTPFYTVADTNFIQYYQPFQDYLSNPWQILNLNAGGYTATTAHRLAAKVYLRIRSNDLFAGIKAAEPQYDNHYIIQNPNFVYAVTIASNLNARTLAVYFLPDWKNDSGEYIYTYDSWVKRNSPITDLWIKSTFDEVQIIRYTPTATNFEEIANVYAFTQYIDIAEAGTYQIAWAMRGMHSAMYSDITPFVAKHKDYAKIVTRISSLMGDIDNAYWSHYNGNTSVPYLYATMNFNVADILPQRSYKALTIADMLPARPFPILLKYSKIMGLVWVVNDDNGTVTVMRRSDYFDDCLTAGKITDLSDKIDGGQEIDVVPTAWQEKRVLLDYDDSDEHYAKAYKERYGRGYGSKTVYTGNTTNEGTLELLNTSDNNAIKPSVMSAEHIKPVQYYSGNIGAVQDFPQLANESEDGESVNEDNKFAFRCSNDAWLARINRFSWFDGNVYLTDDTFREIVDNKFCWLKAPDTMANEAVVADVRPVLDTITPDGLYSVNFAEAQEEYRPAPSTPPTYLYDVCWANYISEVYNVENKTVKLRAMLDSKLYKSLKASPFVLINSQLFVCNSVDGFTGGWSSCTLELRRVDDVAKLRV